MKDIVTDKPEGIEEEGVTTTQGDVAEANETAQLEVDPRPPQEIQPVVATKAIS